MNERIRISEVNDEFEATRAGLSGVAEKVFETSCEACKVDIILPLKVRLGVVIGPFQLVDVSVGVDDAVDMKPTNE